MHHWLLGLCWPTDLRALGLLGKGAFLGALAIPGFFDTGAALTEMAVDALGADDGAGA